VKRAFKTFVWVITAAVVLATASGIYWLYTLPKWLADVYGQWAVGEMVIRFHEIQKRLPENWEELAPMHNDIVHATKYSEGELGNVIGVDFGLLKVIEQKALAGGSRERLPEAIFARSGRQSCWSGAEPNELVFDYFVKQTEPRWYPRVAVVPSNALRFYLVFPAPMTTGDIFTHLQLIDIEKHEPVAGAFREVELWSPDTKRLTVWLHPGRQKSGVNLNDDEGPVLIEGRHYTLVLDRNVTTTQGVELPADVTLTFTVGPSVHAVLDSKEWTVMAPHAEVKLSWPKAPVELRFGRTMDWAMVHEAVKASAPGIVLVEECTDGTSWLLYPDSAWTSETHFIEVSPDLEDMAGNNLNRPFEVDVSIKSNARPVERKPVRIEFEVRP